MSTHVKTKVLRIEKSPLAPLFQRGVGYIEKSPQPPFEKGGLGGIFNQNTMRFVADTVFPLVVLTCVAIAFRFYLIHHIGWDDYFHWTLIGPNNGVARQPLFAVDQMILAHRYSYLGHPPGYPLFLLLFRLAHVNNLQIVRMAQGIISGLMVWPLFYVLDSFKVKRWIAYAGILMFALFPIWSLTSVEIRDTWISPSIIILTAFFLMLSLRSSGWKQPLYYFCLGLCIAIGVMFRPDLLLLVIVGLLWLLVCRKNFQHLLASFTCLLLGMGLIMGSWGLYNKLENNQWLFTCYSSGQTLIDGLGELSNPYGYYFNDGLHAKTLAKLGIAQVSDKANQYWHRIYINALKEHPLYVVKVALYRMFRTLKLVAPRGIRVPFIVALFEWLVLIAAIILYRRDAKVLFIMLFPMLYAFFSIDLIHFESRYLPYPQLTYLFANVFVLMSIASRKNNGKVN